MDGYQQVAWTIWVMYTCGHGWILASDLDDMGNVCLWVSS
jgi:hypothetical protein